MIKNEEFTKNYLEKIIIASEQHTINEWLDAFRKLAEILNELNLDIYNMKTESLENDLAENGPQVINEAKRSNYCTELVLDLTIKIVQTSSREKFQYDDVSELIRKAWWELISFFDYSPNLYINIYALCLFNNAALALKKSVNIVANKLSG